MNELFSNKGYTPTWCKKEPTHSREEILKALEVIKAVCEENECRSCPLRSVNTDDECGILIEAPSCWDIVEETHWHAFV